MGIKDCKDDMLYIMMEDEIRHIISRRTESRSNDCSLALEKVDSIRNNERLYKSSRKNFKKRYDDANSVFFHSRMLLAEEKCREDYFEKHGRDVTIAVCNAIADSLNESELSTADMPFMVSRAEETFASYLDPSSNKDYRHFIIRAEGPLGDAAREMVNNSFYIGESDANSFRDGKEVDQCILENNEDNIIIDRYYDNVSRVSRDRQPIYSVKRVFIVNELDDVRLFIERMERDKDPSEIGDNENQGKSEIMYGDPLFMMCMNEDRYNEICRRLKKGESVLYGYDDIIHDYINYDDGIDCDSRTRTPDRILKCYFFVNNLGGNLFTFNESMIDDLDSLSLYDEEETEDDWNLNFEDTFDSIPYSFNLNLSVADKDSIADDVQRYVSSYNQLINEMRLDIVSSDGSENSNYDFDESSIRKESPEERQSSADFSDDDILINDDFDDSDADDSDETDGIPENFQPGENGIDKDNPNISDDESDTQVSSASSEGDTDAIFIADRIICHMTPEMCYLNLDNKLGKVMAVKKKDIYSYQGREYIKVIDSYYTLYKITKWGDEAKFSMTRETASEELLRSNFDVIKIRNR